MVDELATLILGNYNHFMWLIWPHSLQNIDHRTEKTTFMNRLAYDWAKSYTNSLIPVLFKTVLFSLLLPRTPLHFYQGLFTELLFSYHYLRPHYTSKRIDLWSSQLAGQTLHTAILNYRKRQKFQHNVQNIDVPLQGMSPWEGNRRDIHMFRSLFWYLWFSNLPQAACGSRSSSDNAWHV